MNTTCATNLTVATEMHSSAFDDASAWARAGQAWHCRLSAGSAGMPGDARVGRTVLVNSVLGALKRFDCGLCSDADVAGALHDAVRRFNQRVA